MRYSPIGFFKNSTCAAAYGGMMRRFTALVIAMVFWSAGVISAEVLIKPNDTNINYYGRCDFSKSTDSVVFSWPGTIIEASFPGPSIGVELRDGGAHFDVEIDGVRGDSLAPSTSTTHRTISTTLTAANHTIRLILRTNGQVCSFRGFYLADGSKLAARPAKPTRRIEFIGDSWTAGDVIFAPVGGSGNANTFKANLTYARLTSKAFHAEDHITARGGCGLIKSQSSAPVMATRFPETICDKTTPAWDFTSWKPDLVTICLGINDFSIGGVTDSAFKVAYVSLINTVRSKYTNVPIILIGINSNQSGHNILTNVQAIAPSFTGITVFSSPITLSNAGALYQHPTQPQHKLISDSLIPVVKRVMGWDTTAPVGVIAPAVKAMSRYGAGSVIKTSLDKIDFPANLSGLVKEVAAYDCAGRLMRKIVTAKQSVSLSRDFGLPAGMYLIKTTGRKKAD